MQYYYKGIFIVILSFLFAQQTHAQFSIGVFGNLSKSALSGNAPTSTEYNSLTSFGGGVMLDYQLTDEVILSLQPMLLPKGTTVSYDLPSYEEQRDSLEVNFSYFSIPLMIKVSATKVVYVSGGLELDFLQSATTTLINYDSESDVENMVASMDIAFNFGVGFTFEVSSINIFFELRYSQGLLNISDFPENSETDLALEFKNTGTQLLVGIMYPFGR